MQSATWVPSNNPYWYQIKDSRKTHDPQLWIVGCSFANGNWIEPAQRYGQLIADNIEMDASWLTLGGTSIDWASDQILRADIKTNDVVVWGITGVNRRAWFDQDGNVYRLGAYAELFPGYFSSTIGKTNRDVRAPYLIDLLTDRSNVYHSIRSIMQVIELSKKLNFKLFTFAHTELSLSVDATVLEDYLQQTNCYIKLPREPYLDTGDDQCHPGPAQNQLWANYILDYMKR